MIDDIYIEKNKPDPDGLDFDSLKREGIALLQDLSGQAWTDYNLHDPGVTILEVLCYALTDLVYRTEFDTADFLSGQDGRIDFEKQALFRPQDIFPSQPITVDDYRKIIFAATPVIDNVWITPVGPDPPNDTNGQPRGLYSIFVMPQAEISEENTRKGLDRQQIKTHVRRIYAANRNLCEDLMAVKIIEPVYYTLHGTVEIGGQRDPADILAEIYFSSANYLSPGLGFVPFEEMLRKGKSLAEIFTGPLTEPGCISAEDLGRQRKYAQVSDLMSLISEIEGVKYVDELWFGDGLNFIEYDRTLETMPCLRLPENDSDIAVRLEKNGRHHDVSLKNARVEFERLRFEDRTLRTTRQDIAGVGDLPQGQYRNFRDYYSIQHHFPEIYGVGKYGVPRQPWPTIEEKTKSIGGAISGSASPAAQNKWESTRRKARARQLKAYLLIFEQIMANFLANLQELSRLFSLDDQLKQSYFSQLLDEDIVPAVAEIYREPPAQIESEIARQLRKYDNFSHRRNRILDYLLGIYGEKFSQNSLRRFNYYHTGQELKQELILNKITFLKHIVDLSRKRAGAFDYLEPSWDTENISCLKKKVSILLGLRNFHNRSLAKDADPLECEGCHIIEHILLRPLGKQSHDAQVPDNFYSFKISVLFPAWTPRFANTEFRKLAEETVHLNCLAHVLPEIYWLNFAKMHEFEALYRGWLEIKSDSDASETQIDECSQKLIEFLRDHQEPDSDSKESADQN